MRRFFDPKLFVACVVGRGGSVHFAATLRSNSLKLRCHSLARREVSGCRVHENGPRVGMLGFCLANLACSLGAPIFGLACRASFRIAASIPCRQMSCSRDQGLFVRSCTVTGSKFSLIANPEVGLGIVPKGLAFSLTKCCGGQIVRT